MTKKDYELIARVMATAHDHARHFGGADKEFLDRIAKEFADELQRTNPRFDRDRFLRACKDSK